MSSRPAAAAVLLVAFAFVLAGCGGASDPVQAQPVVFSGRVVDPLTAPQRIAQGFTPGVELTGRAAAVKSHRYVNTYFVAVQVRQPSGDVATGLWATADLDDSLVVPINDVAKTVSTFAAFGKMSMADDGAQEAIAAVG